MRVNPQGSTNQQERLAAYLDHLTQSAGHADRVVPMANYTKGLLLPIERKSVEPMAARLAPDKVRQMHQSLHHIVADAAWSDAVLLKQVRCQVLPAMTLKHALAAWIVDDTGFPKKGTHSVGVTRQYCGQVGKQENCRIAVSVSVATEQASLPVAYRLYLPEIWAQDPTRRKKTGVPEEIRFQTKPEIALDQIRMLVEEEVPRAVVLADAAYQPVVKVWIPVRNKLNDPQPLFLQCAHGNGHAQAAGEARGHLDCAHRVGISSGTSVLSAAKRVTGGRALRRVCRRPVCEVLCGEVRPAVADTGDLLPVTADRVFRGHRQ